jgi:carnitine O-acetyltransferase
MTQRPLSSTSKLHQVSNPSPKPLYASNSSLPRLPVPSLNSTLHKYLETLQPIVSTTELQASTQAVKDFLNSSLSSTLQARLEARASEKTSWLSEWWNETAYMGYRDRIVPFVNYFYVHKKGLGNGVNQTRRAAELIRAVKEFRDLVEEEVLEPEKIKGKPVDTESYKHM